MDEHTAFEQAIKNAEARGFKKGYREGYEAGKRDAVVHAAWRLNGCCTNCTFQADVESIGFNHTGGTSISYKRTRFCPNCGARMDAKEE